MNELKIFKHEKFGEVRSIDDNGQILFVANDVARILGYSNTRDAIRKHCHSGDVAKRDGGSEVSNQYGKGFGTQKSETNYLTESGIYALIFGSKLPAAVEFKHWVTSEVLPSIRRTGRYELGVPVTQLLTGENGVNYVDFLREHGMSLTSGSFWRRKKRYRGEFSSFSGEWYISVFYANVLLTQQEILRQRNELRERELLLPF